MSAEAAPAGELSARIAIWATLLLAVALIGGSAVTTVTRLTQRLQVEGPNSVGEEGKVFYARRAQLGRSIFLTADEPPHYPAFHGALLHAAVGWLGAVAGAEIGDLYLIGRTVSVVATLASIALLVLLLRALGSSRSWWVPALAVALFLASEPMLEHSVSYRPDLWVLSLSALACYLLVRWPEAKFTLPVLVVLPAVAFFVKAPALSLAAATAAGWLVRRDGRSAAWCFLGALSLTSGLLLGLNTWTGGRLAAGLSGGLAMGPSSWFFTEVLLRDPRHWLPCLAPLFLLGVALGKAEEPGSRLRIVTVYWAVALLVALVTARRYGSNTYYFLESWFYGVALLVSWGGRVEGQARGLPRQFRRTVLTPFALGLLLALSLPLATPLTSVLRHQPQDATISITQAVGASRRHLADIVNAHGWRCFSDDSGLNVLLDQPEVVYANVHSVQFRMKRIDEEELCQPFLAQRYDLIALCDMSVQYRGLEELVPEVYQALEDSYRQLDVPDFPYRIFVRGRPEDDVSQHLRRALEGEH